MKNTKRTTAAAQRPVPDAPAAAPPARHEAIADLAYSYWEADGRPEGSDMHYWLRAERELLVQRGDA
ncbi:MAG: DUF2934 domain-containing protein [Bryobacterales bacterium]|nr:DUF2934 domain-containing protein [Bryobacterales bacterium]